MIRSTQHTYEVFSQNTLIKIKSSFNQTQTSNRLQEIQEIKEHVKKHQR